MSGRATTDDDGEELPDIAAAEREASLSLLKIAQEDLKELRGSLFIEIRDEAGQKVSRVRMSLEIERVKQDR